MGQFTTGLVDWMAKQGQLGLGLIFAIIDFFFTIINMIPQLLV